MIKTLRIILCVFLSACSPPTLEQQHAAAMRRHIYMSDQEQYGREDVWTPSLKGDCEDYALWMRERVGGQLLYVRTQQGEPHMVLIVGGVYDKKKNPIAGKVIDNLSKHVYPVSEMKHKFVYTLTDWHVENYLKRMPVPR